MSQTIHPARSVLSMTGSGSPGAWTVFRLLFDPFKMQVLGTESKGPYACKTDARTPPQLLFPLEISLALYVTDAFTLDSLIQNKLT